MRFVRSESIEINANREQVFALVSNLPAQHNAVTKASMQLVSSASPHRCVHECRDGSAAYRWTFDLTTSPTGTTVHQTVERVGGPGYARVLQQIKAAAEQPAIPQQRQEADAPRTQVPGAYS